MKRILVPCNFSTYAEMAIQFATELARVNNAEILLLTVLQNPDPGIPVDAEEIALTTEAQKQKFTHFMKSHNHPSVAVSHLVRYGQITPVVLDVIEKNQIDVVVMGTHGSRGWNEFFMGSNVEKIVRTSPVPVFAVKKKTTIRSVHNIVFPTNLQLNQKDVVEKIKAIQEMFHAKLHLLRIGTEEDQEESEVLAALEVYASHYQLSNYTVSVRNTDDIRQGILQFAREMNSDMILMATHGNRDPKDMYKQSITADVVNHANLPVWTCCTEKRVHPVDDLV
jgi:nucleotide-binding universal stress UspA family protein